MANNLSGLIIPMKVLAYRVQNGTKKVPALTPNYKVAASCALGKDITPDAFNKRIELQEGIHLHFILPSVLKHGVEDKDDKKTTIKYPNVPDKYIVTRMYVNKSGKIVYDCNIVDSYFISTKNSGNCITIPSFDAKGQPYRYLGRQYSAFKKKENAPNEADEGYLDGLQVIGPGDPLFNAYYPSCRSVFGFYDNLEDVPKNAILTYSVIGFYSDSMDSKNPLAKISTKENFEQFLKENNLSAEKLDNFQDYNKCLVFGEICGIDLSKKNPLPLGEINVGIGRTSAEALSAVIAGSYPSDNINERTLTTLQYDMTDEISQIDGNFKIDDGIHAFAFNPIAPIETSFDITIPKEVKYKEDTKIQEPSDTLGAFNKLCEAQHELGKHKRLLEYKKKTLYYLWELYIKSKEYPLKGGIIAKKISDTINEINDIRAKKIESLVENIKNVLKPNLEESIKNTIENNDIVTIDVVSSKPFYYPKDPAVMLFGSGIKRNHVFGEEELLDENKTLPCLISPLGNNRYDENYNKISELVSNVDFHPDICSNSYKKFFVMTVMLDENLRQAIGATNTITEKCSPIMVNTNPYEEVPLFMEWEAKFHNNYTDSTPSKSSLQYIDTDYTYNGLKNENGRWSIGTSLLTPHGAYNLGEKIEKYLQNHSDNSWENLDNLKQLVKDIKNIPAISQNLGGFTASLSSLKSVFQIPMKTNDDITKAVYNCLEDCKGDEQDIERLAVIDDSDVIPLREGFLDLKKLSLVSTFGNTRQIMDGEKRISGNHHRLSENISLKVSCQDEANPDTDDLYVNNECFLPLALTTPARLSSYFLSATDNSIRSCSLPGSSPIIAIIMPDMLNRNLDIFDNTGELIGLVKSVFRTNDDGEKIPTGKAILFKENIDDRISKFINAIQNNDSYIIELTNIINVKLSNTIPIDKHDFIFGHALVLAEMNIELEYFGGPEFSKRTDLLNEDSCLRLDDKNLFEQIFPVMVGDINRVTDGVICGFYNTGTKNMFEKGFAPFGYNTKGNKYLNAAPPTVSGRNIETKIDSDPKTVTLLFDPMLKVTLSTGFLPVEQIQINARHTDFSSINLKLVEMNTLISEEETILLPDFTKGDSFKRKYPILEKKSTGKETTTYKDIDINNNLATAPITTTIITDGFIAKNNQGA